MIAVTGTFGTGYLLGTVGVFPMDFDGFASAGKNAFDLVSSGLTIADKLRDLFKRREGDGTEADIAVRKLIADLLDQLVNARSAQLSLSQAIDQLVAEVKEMDRKLEFKRDYEPMQTAGGAFVLAPKSGTTPADTVHYICPDCADQGRRSYLQPDGTGRRCSPCKQFFPFEPVNNIPRFTRRNVL